jgi:class 3 adenylate cyclase
MVSDSVRRAAGEDFAFGLASGTALKGFDAPVAAFRLLRDPP